MDEHKGWELTYNLLLCGFAFPVMLYFINKWITNLEKKISEFCSTNRDDHKDLFDTDKKIEHRVTVIETSLGMSERT